MDRLADIRHLRHEPPTSANLQVDGPAEEVSPDDGAQLRHSSALPAGLSEQILDVLPHGLVIADQEQKIIYANSAFCELTGYRLQELLRRNCRLLQGPDSSAKTSAQIRKALFNGEPFEGLILNYRKDGSTFWNELTITPVHAAGALHFVGASQDVTERVENELEQRRSMARLTAATHAGKIATWEQIVESDRLIWDERSLELYGITADEFGGRGEDWLRHVHPEDRDRVLDLIEKATAARTPYHALYRIVRPSGEIRHVDESAVIFYDEAGNPERYFGTVIDVTERVQRETDLRRALARLSLANDAANAAIWEWNIATNELFWSEELLAMYGTSAVPPEATYAVWERSVHPADLPRAEADIEDALRDGGDRFRSTYRIVRPDGEIRHLIASATIERDDQGRAIRMVGVETDITDLRNAELRLRDAIDNLDVSFALFDRKGDLVLWNRAFERDFSFMAPHLKLGVTYGETVRRLAERADWPNGEEGRRAWIMARLEALEQSCSLQIEYRANGRVHLIDHQPRAEGGLVVIHTDVTRLMVLALEREEQLRRATEASKAKSKFLAVMSHELRTPLNAIIGFSDLIRNERLGPLSNESYKGYAIDINESGKHLLSLIDDILDLSRIESGKYELQIEPVDPAELEYEIARKLSSLAADKGVTVLTPDNLGAIIVAADRRAVRQLLINLISNAIKFTPQGGTITLSAEIAADGDMAVMAVADTGRGIPASMIPLLGEAFVQASGPLDRDVGGMGLGLAISKSLAQAMKGRLEIDSLEGFGTTIRVYLPLVQSQAECA